MKIAVGNDHSATDLKVEITKFVESMGHEVINFGTDGYESCDYPIYGEKVGRAVAAGEADCGILICGTAHLIKEHNNANVIAFGARIVGSEQAKDIVKAYLEAEFMGGRHQNRIDMISKLEE